MILKVSIPSIPTRTPPREPSILRPNRPGAHRPDTPCLTVPLSLS